MQRKQLLKNEAEEEPLRELTKVQRKQLLKKATKEEPLRVLFEMNKL